MSDFQYVSENSKYVKVNYDKVLEFIENLDTPNYEHWSEKVNLQLDEEEWILLAFLIESMNFCFWQKPKWKIDYHEDLMSGSNALFFFYHQRSGKK